MSHRPLPLAAQTLILGVGSPLRGDDAIGILTVQALQQRTDLPTGVDVIDGGTDGLGLIPILEAYPRVIVVDAIEMGLLPGTLRRFTWEDVRVNARSGGLSLHESGLGTALSLAEALGCLPRQLVFFGVQPHDTAWDAPLSPAVARTLPRLVQALLHEVGSETMMAHKILIIEDDPDVVLATRMPLEHAGYEVYEAHSQSDGFAAVDVLKPDLIILDVMMDTHTAGFQLAHDLHGPTAKPEHIAIPILMLSAIHQTTPLRFGPDPDYLPVDAYIEKPIDPHRLLSEVETLLGK